MVSVTIILSVSGSQII